MPIDIPNLLLGLCLAATPLLAVLWQWQRRLQWSTTQSQLELSRDRLNLFARVLFYILIGIMVTVLYIPIFSVASMVGVH